MLSYSAPTSEDSLTSPRSDSYLLIAGVLVTDVRVVRGEGGGSIRCKTPKAGIRIREGRRRDVVRSRLFLPKPPARRETMVSAHVAVASKQQAVPRRSAERSGQFEEGDRAYSGREGHQRRRARGF